MTVFHKYAAHRADARVGNFRPLSLERFVQLTKAWL